MPINESWLYFGELLLIFAMKHKRVFLFGLGTLMLISIFSTSQVTLSRLNATPIEELIDRLPNDSSRLMLHKIVRSNQEVQNELELIKRDITPKNGM